MLDKEFVPYNEALDLKELGFDKPCFGYYIELRNPKEGILTIEKCENTFDDLLAPTFSQAFRWFREKYELHHLDLLSLLFLEQKMNYEEAELACLRKLIEIVKQQKLNHDLMSGDIVGY